MNGSSEIQQLKPRKKKTKFCSKQLNLSSFFKSSCSRDVVEAKSSLSASLTLHCATQRARVQRFASQPNMPTT